MRPRPSRALWSQQSSKSALLMACLIFDLFELLHADSLSENSCVRPQNFIYRDMVSCAYTATYSTVHYTRVARPPRNEPIKSNPLSASGLLNDAAVDGRNSHRAPERFSAARHLYLRDRRSHGRSQYGAQYCRFASVRYGRRGRRVVGALPSAVDRVPSALRAHQGVV